MEGDVHWFSRMQRTLFGLVVAVCVADAFAIKEPASSVSPNDFQKRCQSQGEIQCFGFDRPSEVIPHLAAAADGRVHALVDENVKVSGAGSLRFDIMPHLGAKLRIPDPGVSTPNPPNSLSATSTSGAVDLKWRNNSERATFEIERCAGNIYECQASQASTKIGVARAHAECFRDGSVVKGKRYTYRVRATNQAGNSAYTNPGVNVPRPPRDLVAAAARSAVNLRWSGNSQDDLEFVVESCPGNACTNFADVVHLPHTQNSYARSGLTGGLAYRYRVRSSNSAGSWITWDKGGVAYTNIASATPL